MLIGHIGTKNCLMSNLVIDIGNTFTKALVFSDDQIIYSERKVSFSIVELEKLIKEYQVQKIIVSSVREEFDIETNQIAEVPVIYFNYKTNIPVLNQYKTPNTLGVDRLAGVIGAKQIYPGKAVLVIDFGSCITFDFVNAGSEYFGGAISPGLKMRFKAMHQFTGKLPEIDNYESTQKFDSLFGTDTTEALQAGVVNGILFEVEGYIKQYNENNIDLKVILCGGDASFFDTRLKNSIFAHQILMEPNLVPIGLNTVVRYQDDKKN